MKIGIRTAKTALGAGLSIWLALLFQLDFYVSAGIITILCIDITKKRSIKVSVSRLSACVLGLFMAGLFFEWFGYHIIVFSFFILVFIPLLNFLRLQDGFITSIVIVLHPFVLEEFNATIAMNEIGLIIIGIGVALIMNMYMPSLVKELKEYRYKIEGKIVSILREYASYIDKGDQGWDGTELLELESLIAQAKGIALRERENHLLKSKDTDYNYFEMRERQYGVLERMLPIVSILIEDVPQRHMFAEFLYDLSTYVAQKNIGEKSHQKLRETRELMKKLPLPETRGEFETRAALIHLMNEMELYLNIREKYDKERQQA